jgi:hypothetical protein
MATPHVSAEAALLLAAGPSLTTQELKDLIMGTVDPRPGLSGLSVTGGRANAGAALRRLAEGDADAAGVARVFDSCPTVPGTAADGCPIVAPPTAGASPQPQGVSGGALPMLRSLKVKVSPRRCRRTRVCLRTARIDITSDRPATGKVTIELRRCARRRCRWVMVARRSVKIAGRTATVRVRSRRLVRGSYRAAAVLSSSLGDGDPRRASFRIR